MINNLNETSYRPIGPSKYRNYRPETQSRKYESDEYIPTSQKTKEPKKPKKNIISKLLDKIKEDKCSEFDAKKQSAYYIKHSIIPADIYIIDGFTDEIEGDKPQTIVFDYLKDKKLDEIKNRIMMAYGILHEEEYARYIMRILGNEAKKGKSEDNNPILVGEAIQNNNPRALAIAFKLLADMVSIKSDLVKGTLNGKPHAWNIIHAKNGTSLVCDCANQKLEYKKDTFGYKQA